MQSLKRGEVMSKSGHSPRSAYHDFQILQTRWEDNDAYGHMNNIVHYSLIDTAVTNWQRRRGFFDALGVKFMVVQSGCTYFAEARYPDTVHAGLRVAKIGRTSWTYEIGLFRNDEPTAFAEGFFAQVQVDDDTARPSPIKDTFRQYLEQILISP
jgi:acyl-CoA thioester hydrolase